MEARNTQVPKRGLLFLENTGKEYRINRILFRVKLSNNFTDPVALNLAIGCKPLDLGPLGQNTKAL